jgi:signal transduction histidine kinase
MTAQDFSQEPSAGAAPERRSADLTILFEVSRALQRTLEEEQALYTILLGITHGRGGLGFNRAFILLVDADETHLEGRLAIGPSSAEEASAIWQELRDKHQSLGEILDELPSTGIKKDRRVNELVAKLRIPLSDRENALVRILRSRQSCVAAGGILQPNGLPVEPALAELLGTGHFAVSPLCLGQQELGLLIADNAITGAPISPASLQLLHIYAQAAGAAIENIRLYRELIGKIAISERTSRSLQQSQHQLLQAERLSTIGKMSAHLAHEIRTPLVAIGGFTRRVLRQTPADDPRRESLEIVVSEVGRLEHLVDQVLGYSRVSTPDYRDADINSLIRSVILTMNDGIQARSVAAVLELDSAMPLARVDGLQLRQALINLVSNALDAMPSGGTLTITTRCEGDFLEIGVSDTGTGIVEEHWSKLFTPFFTTKATGIGLGLAIVSQVVENHHGSVRFESVPGQGSGFHIRLAFDPEARQQKSASSTIVPLEEGAS